MDNLSLWELTQETYRAIVPTYGPVIDHFCTETGLNGLAVSWLLAAFTFEPETISPTRLQVRGPYTAASAYQAKLAALADKSLLAEVKPSEYLLTMRGEIEIIRLLKEVREAIAEADPLPLVASQRLAALLEILVHASLDALPPPNHWSIALAYKLMPAASPPLPYTEQAVSCLNGYRDDAHLAAWQPSGLSATAFETLTLFWRGEADSLEAVSQHLRHRGHSLRVYMHALETLRARGFVECDDGHPHLTQSGKEFRQQVEVKTDRYFFAPWDHLNPDEKSELADLLLQLRDNLQTRTKK